MPTRASARVRPPAPTMPPPAACQDWSRDKPGREREVKMETGRGWGQYGHFSCHVLSVRVPLPLTPNKSWMEGHTGHRKKIRGHTHATNFFRNTEVNTNFYKNIHVKYSERPERGRRSGECWGPRRALPLTAEWASECVWLVKHRAIGLRVGSFCRVCVLPLLGFGLFTDKAPPWLREFKSNFHSGKFGIPFVLLHHLCAHVF